MSTSSYVQTAVVSVDAEQSKSVAPLPADRPSGRRLVSLVPIHQMEERLDRIGLLSWASDLARAHFVTLEDVLGRRQTKSIRSARRAFYRGLREKGLSSPEIGAIVDRDHTAILKGWR